MFLDTPQICSGEVSFDLPKILQPCRLRSAANAPRYFLREEIMRLRMLRRMLVPRNASTMMTTGSDNYFSTAGYIDSMVPLIPYQSAVFPYP